MSTIQPDELLDRRLRAFLDLRAEEVARGTIPASAVAERIAVRPSRSNQARTLRLVVVGMALALLALAAALLIVGTRPEPQLGAWSMARRTVWSPDGSRLAFVALANRTGVPPSPVAGSSSPATSERSAANDLYVVNADGSGLRLVDSRAVTSAGDLAGGFMVLWSHDSRYLAYGHVLPTGSQELVMIEVASGAKVRLAGAGDAWPIAWSPVADRLLFARSGTGNDLYTTGPDGTDERQLTSDHRSAGGIWSPDGSKILFVDGVVGGTQQLDSATWVMAADGTAKVRLGACCDAGWARDGRSAYLDDDGQTLEAVPIDGSTPPGASISLAPGMGWLLAPDGVTVAIGTGTGLVVRHRDGSSDPLTNDSHDVLVAWSPDGRFLAFQGSRSNGAGLFTVPVAGGSPTLVAPGATSDGNPWRPGPDSGNRLVFARDGDLFSSAPDGSDVRRLTAEGPAAVGRTGAASEGPSGQLTIGDHGPDREIYAIPRGPRFAFTIVNTTDERWIVSLPAMDLWQPDCHVADRDAIRLATFTEPVATSPPDPAAPPDACIVAPHQTVTIDQPYVADGPAVLIVARLRPDDQWAMPGYLVTVDFVDPVAPAGS